MQGLCTSFGKCHPGPATLPGFLASLLQYRARVGITIDLLEVAALDGHWVEGRCGLDVGLGEVECVAAGEDLLAAVSLGDVQDDRHAVVPVPGRCAGVHVAGR